MDESSGYPPVFYWGFQLLNMVVQGATKEASPILLASACLIWPALAQTVVLMYQDLYDIKIPRNRTIAVATVGSAIVMYGLYFVGMPFVVYANAPILLVAGMTFRYSWSAFQNISSNRVGRFLDYVFLFCNIVYILQTTAPQMPPAGDARIVLQVAEPAIEATLATFVFVVDVSYDS